jgi:tetratricopeptide (TPR) repeat protein
MAKSRLKREDALAILGTLILVLVIFAAYSNHFQNGFHFDDGHTIVKNAAIRDLRNIPRLFRDATTFSTLPSNQSYRPLVSTLLAIDYHLAGGLRPFWFHFSAFALFLGLALLLAFVIDRLLGLQQPSSANRWIALASAGCYALHPANADAVNYLIVSAEVMATFGVVASFAVYFAFPQLRPCYLYVLPAALAILAKPTAAIFPALFLLFRCSFSDAGRKSSARQTLLEIAPPFLICGAILWLVARMTPPNWMAGARDPRGYLLTQPYIAWRYFTTFFWPTGLSADYDLAPFTSAADPRLWIGIGFVVLLIGAAIVAVRLRKMRLVGFGLLWFLVALLPTSLFPLAEVMNDYRALASYIGLVVALAAAAALLLRKIKQRRLTRLGLVGAVTLALSASGYATFQRNKVWLNEETLWHDVVLKSPQNGRGLMAYGIQLLNKGDYRGALEYFHRAQEFTPEYYVLFINLAIAENAIGKSDLAEAHFQEAMRRGPWDSESYIYYARYLIQHGRLDEARTLLEQALKLSPTDLTARELLKEAQPRPAQAEAIAGDHLLREGKIGLAMSHYERALAMEPDLVSALNNFAWALSTAPAAELRNGGRALSLAKRADEIAHGRNPVFLRTMAAALAESGRFDEAIAAAERARQMALAQQNADLANKLKRELYFYQRHHPPHR